MAIGSDRTRRARPLMGTFVEMTVAGVSPAAREAAIDDAFAAVANAHRLMNSFDADSDVGRINCRAGGDPVPVHGWTYDVLAAAIDLQSRSGGLFAPFAAPASRSRMSKPREVGTHGPCAGGVLDLLPERQVRLRDANMRIDLGGIAKGFAVDRAIDVLCAHGMASGLVNAGGDLRVFGASSETVEIRDPRDPRRPLCAVPLGRIAMASSAGRFDPLCAARPMGCAVIDPRARRSIGKVMGASVLASSCMIADALTKVALIAGTRALPVLRHFGAEALLVTTDGGLMTPGWPQDPRLAA